MCLIIANVNFPLLKAMLELINQLDGFDARGNIKVLMATNRYVVRSIHS
jgi:ATP-dependent 26S proteasome regulatory subunit